MSDEIPNPQDRYIVVRLNDNVECRFLPQDSPLEKMRKALRHERNIQLIYSDLKQQLHSSCKAVSTHADIRTASQLIKKAVTMILDKYKPEIAAKFGDRDNIERFELVREERSLSGTGTHSKLYPAYVIVLRHVDCEVVGFGLSFG
ncbi:MAG: hypothetical protein M1822_009544 [Bathelium mastoideum]|nr:MAG: hypothetical protein M1822_009544 [Bathelium mastoideum]